MFKLYDYQIKAANELASRYNDYRRTNIQYDGQRIPIILTLISITGSGKTPILADTLSRIKAYYVHNPPIFVWISYDKVVVDQTIKNLTEGKYKKLLGQHPMIKQFTNIWSNDIKNPNNFIIYLDTVQKFNSNSRDNRVIFDIDEDISPYSKWEMLKRRERDLIVIYDEVHKLSEAQSNKILELKPQGIITASGTPKHNPTIARYVKYLESKGFSLNTKIPVKAVKEKQLISEYISLKCYTQNEEFILNSLLKSYRNIEALLQKYNEVPKAAYVCSTNFIQSRKYVNQSKKARRDDPDVYFKDRKAAPIMIWRHLVKEGVDPNSIAIRLDIDESSKAEYKFPKEFKDNLFNKSTKNTFDLFLKRNYKHIIFNKSLGTGWDDPYIYQLYIDKSMDSDTEIEQIIGRAIRQPNSRYYSDPDLNIPTIHIKVDNKQIYQKIINELNEKLKEDYNGEINIKDDTDAPDKEREEPKGIYKVPKLSWDVEMVRQDLYNIIDSIPDYNTYSSVDRIGEGIIQSYKYSLTGDYKEEKIELMDKNNTVTARTVFERYVIQKSVAVWGVVQDYVPKFNAHIGWDSKVSRELDKYANHLVDTYKNLMSLTLQINNPYVVKYINVNTEECSENNPKGYIKYNNAIHKRYSNLNKFEQQCAKLIDRIGYPWCKNPYFSGYGIPLIEEGNTVVFYPDFIIWINNRVVLLEVTGDHLKRDKVYRKLLPIRKDVEFQEEMPEDVSINVIIRSGNIYEGEDYKYELHYKKGADPMKGELDDLIRSAITKVG